MICSAWLTKKKMLPFEPYLIEKSHNKDEEMQAALEEALEANPDKERVIHIIIQLFNTWFFL
jgi:hypothetical protein